MTDKISEFRRINEPRAQRAVEQLNHIAKSAASMKMHEIDVAKLLEPVTAKLAELRDQDAVDIIEGTAPRNVPASADWMDGPGTGPAPTPPVAREMEQLENLTTQQLVDRMIACGAILAERRK